ncbi:tyrosine-type recombinase/integrase [Rhodovulum sulfidophilum]|uniref:tyrosine-type recombinase/integrase n=1 Tax=Rhodovulum sulfidophilum TaxID=35806 RepID=UPI0019253418|nr:tyrosine-type recombinase/integrase [Rhodovulum sulfidophilum]MBL3587300.1 tyrosine-type recombinase/integrase [Rhodovulum sulfidophilum]
MTKRELPKYVYRQRNGLYFQRRGWPSQKIGSDFGSPEFWAEYAAILKGEGQAKVLRRNFSALIRSYHQSPRYRNLKPRTALDYDKFTAFIDERFGPLNPANLQRRDVIRLRDENAGKPYFANYAVKVIRILMEHSIDLGWRTDNPAKGVSLLKADADPRLPWPQSLIDAFRAAVPLGARERLLMELCLGTGQRIGDVLEMQWGDIQDGGITVKQNKTGKRLWVPIVPSLQEALDRAPRRSLFMLTNQSGTSRWSYRGASQAIRKIREDIGALDFDIHSWRYNAACELVEAGCTDELVAAVTGQSPKMVAHYTQQIRQRVRAIEAQARRKKPSTGEGLAAKRRTEQKRNV